ncbi:type II toxin-antitoxin system VapC family toxin [Rhodothermus marinus]|jgi:predicted nucleic acid-binding protein|uniref:type II toxin-antitoxin system VapC family toxin n=1 Tax=Rhodothermus marinus TaxID=29549 RepID=UPI001D2EB442|nr:type II toxin-antitoxin system VapC family toxin [Rhodothermus marinus]MBO2491411.1 type II toxin-antitoxin system VapC family toxin [Rhodothermus marinus]
MILLDSDVMIDLLRGYPPAVSWFETLDEEEEIALPGFVAMELIQGCRSKKEQRQLQRSLIPFGVVWPLPEDCDRALELFMQYHLSHGVGMLDVLIAQTALALEVPLYTFNQKHYQFLSALQTVQPYPRS